MIIDIAGRLAKELASDPEYTAKVLGYRGEDVILEHMRPAAEPKSKNEGSEGNMIRDAGASLESQPMRSLPRYTETSTL